nr:hypothetical protein CFP56_57019 [Quercus suber]
MQRSWDSAVPHASILELAQAQAERSPANPVFVDDDAGVYATVLVSSLAHRKTGSNGSGFRRCSRFVDVSDLCGRGGRCPRYCRRNRRWTRVEAQRLPLCSTTVEHNRKGPTSQTAREADVARRYMDMIQGGADASSRHPIECTHARAILCSWDSQETGFFRLGRGLGLLGWRARHGRRALKLRQPRAQDDDPMGRKRGNGRGSRISRGRNGQCRSVEYAR